MAKAVAMTNNNKPHKFKIQEAEIPVLANSPEQHELKKLEAEMRTVALSKTQDVEENVQEYDELYAKHQELEKKLNKQGLEKIRRILKECGVVYKDGNVYVPKGKQGRKKLQNNYSESTFEDALEYFSSEKEPPAEDLLNNIYSLVAENINVNEYPNMKRFGNVVELNGKWNELKM